MLKRLLALSAILGAAIATIAVSLLALLHLVLAPLLLPVRVLTVGFLARMGEKLEASIPRDEAIRGKTLVILSSSAELTTFPPWMQRQVLGGPRPRSMRLLATCFAKVQVSRLDATTLRVRPENGFLDNELLRMVRGLSRPFRRGDEVVLSDLRVRVHEVTADGRPAEVDFEFAVPLEDQSLMWTRLQAGGALAPWSPPAVGERQVLPSVSPRRAPGQTDSQPLSPRVPADHHHASGRLATPRGRAIPDSGSVTATPPHTGGRTNVQSGR